MKTALRILSYYTILLAVPMVFMPAATSIAGESGFEWPMVLGLVGFLPVIALAGLILGPTGGRTRRTALWSCAGYTALVFLARVVGSFMPPHDPMLVISAVLWVPVVVFAALVLVVLRKGVA